MPFLRKNICLRSYVTYRELSVICIEQEIRTVLTKFPFEKTKTLKGEYKLKVVDPEGSLVELHFKPIVDFF